MNQPSTGRLHALDGLRGIAALVVVVHHAALSSPALAAAYRSGPGAQGPAALAAYSPLHLPWAGTEAVVIFFVLSGLVLTLPFLQRRPDWASYYPRRLVRLYIPVWGAVALAVLWWLLVTRSSVTGLSWWVNRHDVPLDGRTVADMALLTRARWVNSALWSLKWEVLFSLLLPVYLWLGMRWRRGLPVKVIALLMAMEVGVQTGNGWLRYLPIFAFGVLLAVERDRLRQLACRLTRRGFVLVLVVALLLLDASWLTRLGYYVVPAVVVGAVVLVALFVVWPSAISLGEQRLVQWLGRISFSLYLVHEPIVVSVAFLLHTTNPWLVVSISLPVSLLLAAGFYRAVELPAHRLSRTVSRKVSGAFAPSAHPWPHPRQADCGWLRAGRP